MKAFRISNVHLIDPENQTVNIGNITVKDGLIAVDDASVPTIDGKNKYLAPGIVDVGAKVCEPGERHKESFRSAGVAAAAGGVTTLVTRPDTQPAIDSPETLEFASRRALAACIVNTYQMAALTKGRLGREMTEISFLQDAGAVAFTDCDAVVTDTKVLSRALTYASQLGALVIGHPQDPGLSKGAAATSGKFASLRAIPAVSPMAERLGIERDLAIVEMTKVKYHADQISSELSLPALAQAKQKGLDVTAGVSIHHLTLNEFDVADYRSFFKVKPPLRSEADRQAMVAALASGLIDIISSMHTPQDEESKRLPYEQAASGAVALETLLPAALRLYHAEQLSLPQLFSALSLNPAKRFGLPGGTLAEGAPADLLLFDPDVPFVLDRFKLNSKSKNTPFDGQKMQGIVLATFVAGQKVYER
jgi:dihydroorotase